VGTEEGNGRASLRDVYQIVQRIEDKVESVEDKLDKRLRSLENWRWWMTGIGSVIVLGLGLLARFIVR
jgi:hypothetical protein